MRTSLSVVSALLLAACSSSTASTSINPQMPNVAAALHRANPNELSLTFQNDSIASVLFMDADSRNPVCIQSVEPADIQLLENQTAKVDIKGDDQGGCKGGSREVHFLTGLVQIGGIPVWQGALIVKYDPQRSEWTGKLEAGGHNVDLCTDPPGFARGQELKLDENELIGFHFCKRRR